MADHPNRIFVNAQLASGLKKNGSNFTNNKMKRSQYNQLYPSLFPSSSSSSSSRKSNKFIATPSSSSAAIHHLHGIQQQHYKHVQNQHYHDENHYHQHQFYDDDSAIGMSEKQPLIDNEITTTGNYYDDDTDDIAVIILIYQLIIIFHSFIHSFTFFCLISE